MDDNGEFGIIESALKRLTENGADDAIVEFNRVENSMARWFNSRLSIMKNWDEELVSVFASFKKRIITGSFQFTNDESLRQNIDRLSRYALKLSRNEEFEGIADGPFEYSTIDNYDESIASSPEEGVEQVRGAIEKVKEKGVERSAGIFSTVHGKRWLISSRNAEGYDKWTNALFSIRALATKEATGHEVKCSSHIKDINFEELASLAADTALLARNPEEGPRGRFNVLFKPLSFSNIVDNVGEALSAFNVEAGISPFKDSINKAVASSIFTLYDDATLSHGSASRRFDDEGVPSRRNLLIDRGVLKTYMHNTSTAKRYGAETTSNAGIISPEPSNLVVANGSLTFDGLLDSVDRAILITNVWYTRFQNHSTGDFSTIPRDGAFIVENGEIVKSIKNIRVSGNLVEMVKNIKALGNDSLSVDSWEVESPVTTPSALVSDVEITKSVK